MVSSLDLLTLLPRLSILKLHRIVLEYVDGGDLLDYTMKKKGLCKRLPFLSPTT